METGCPARMRSARAWTDTAERTHAHTEPFPGVSLSSKLSSPTWELAVRNLLRKHLCRENNYHKEKKKAFKIAQMPENKGFFYGVPERIRTFDLPLRSWRFYEK